jgi:hypothetical protein
MNYKRHKPKRRNKDQGNYGLEKYFKIRSELKKELFYIKNKLIR